MKKEPLTPFEEFVARRVAEFPTLYKGPGDVITNCILGTQGECFWKDGVLHQGDQHWDEKKKKWTQYPKRMSLEVAREFHSYKMPTIPYNVGHAQAPISQIPKDADKSYLQGIGIFLYVWSELTDEDWQLLAKAKCLIVYQRQSNEAAGEPNRTLENFRKFAKQIPEWRARIHAVEHFQHYGEADPKTYQGLDI